MELERCYSVLAVSSSLKFNESIRGLLPESRYFPVTVMRPAPAESCWSRATIWLSSTPP